ncbi:DNA-binding protein [Litorisediminicola beolgyonensis]|uniref:DNA-binding protein n=1 Tax=Litorisediminicola beolgyonensis TaxID=1173614 RepID=A0ABW3ZKF6_9RHOB
MRDTNQNTKPNDALLTVSDVAWLDQVSEKTVRRAIAYGLLDALRVGPKGRLIRIHPEAHARYRRGQTY